MFDRAQIRQASDVLIVNGLWFVRNDEGSEGMKNIDQSVYPMMKSSIVCRTFAYSENDFGFTR